MFDEDTRIRKRGEKGRGKLKLSNSLFYLPLGNRFSLHGFRHAKPPKHA